MMSNAAKMSANKVIIAKLLPVTAKAENGQIVTNNRLVRIKLKNIADLCQWSDDSMESMDVRHRSEEMADKPKRKRERLDHLSLEEKIKRRKLHNRAAAQLARDRKKSKMTSLMETVEALTKQRALLQKSNEILMSKNKSLEEENVELKKRLSSMASGQSAESECAERFVGSAELINVSQQQKHESIRASTQWMRPLIYWLALMNLMRSSTFSTSAPNSCSKQTSPTTPVSTTRTLSPQSVSIAPNWSPSKT